MALGVAIGVLYVAVAHLSFRSGLVPVRPLYDGTQTVQPYRWVNPPAKIKHSNVAPVSATGTFKIGATSAPPFFLSTDDSQVSVIFPPKGVVPMAGQTSVKLSIKPLDPATVGSPPPGLDYDGNAYSVTGVYLPSGKPIQIPQVRCSISNANACTTVVLRYAFSATSMYLLQGTTWTKVVSQISSGALQIYGETNMLGTFVAAEQHVPGGLQPKSQTGNIIAFVIGLAAILLGTFAARVRASRKRRSGEAARGSAGAKRAPPVKPRPARPKPKKPGKAERQRRKEEEEDKPWWRD